MSPCGATVEALDQEPQPAPPKRMLSEPAPAAQQPSELPRQVRGSDRARPAPAGDEPGEVGAAKSHAAAPRRHAPRPAEGEEEYSSPAPESVDEDGAALHVSRSFSSPDGMPSQYGCAPCDDCGPCDGCEVVCGDESCVARKLWVRAEYLLWWEQGFSTPPLVTTSPAGTAATNAGSLDTPGTVILAGNDVEGTGARSGERITLGYWLDPNRTVGVEAIYTGLGLQSWQYAFDGGTTPILARPFYRLEPTFTGQDAELVAYPNVLQGGIQVSGSTQLQSVEVLWRNLLLRTSNDRINFIAGWRFNRLDDSLLIQDSKTTLSVSSGVPVGTNLQEYDLFKTQNQFNGAEIGIVGAIERCRWSLELSMKMALGCNSTRVEIGGQTTSTTPVAGGNPTVTTRQTGLLAQQTNIGVYDSNEFAVVPELGATLTYRLTRRLRASVGYTFMYWDNVSRPGDQIDTNLNLTQLSSTGLSGAPAPKFTRVATDFWAQGINLGLEYRF